MDDKLQDRQRQDRREERATGRGKRGQITVFIIVGILLLILAALAIFLRGTLTERAFEKAAEQQQLPSDIAPINNYVELCLQRSLAPGVFLLGAQGGYITPPEGSLTTQNAVVAYGAVDGKPTMPDASVAERQLAGYTEDAISLCLLNLSEFRRQGYDIEAGKPSAIVHVTDDKVLVNLDYPLAVRKGNASYELRFFSANVPIRLGHVLQVANDIVNGVTDDPGDVDFRSLSTHDAYITVLPYDQESIIYAIRDENSTVDDAPFTFMLATKDKTRNTPPKLDFIGNIVTKQDTTVTVQVTASDGENDHLTFYTNDELFPIDPETGEMRVSMTTPGVYTLLVGVRDTKGSSDEQDVQIVVEHG